MSEAVPGDAMGVAGRRWVLPMVLALALALFMQGSRGIYESTEGRYTRCAVETIESANPLEPVLNGEHHWTKPPLTYWAIGAGTAVLGNNGWGARLYLAVAFVLTVAAVCLLEESLPGRGATGWGALVYAASPYTVMAANVVSTDTLLTLFEVAAMAFFWTAWRRGGRCWVVLTWLALGLAFATKGPIGLLPLVAIIPANRMLRRRDQRPVALWSPLGLLVFAVVGLSWYAYVVARHPGLIQAWFMEELVGRTLFDAHGRLSSKPHKILSVYLPIVLFGTGPWLVYVLYRQRALLRRGLVGRLVADREAGAANLFLLLATAVPVVIFSLSTSRLPLYLVPIFAPLTIGLARVLAHLGLRHRSVLRAVLVTALLVAVAKGVVAYKSSYKNMADLAAVVPRNRTGAPLLALFRSPLNGLSFLLDQPVPVLYFDGSLGREELAARMEETGGLAPLAPVANGEGLPTVDRDGRTYYRLPAGADVVVRRKDAVSFGPLLGEERWEVVGATRHWTVLRLREAFEVPANAVRRPSPMPPDDAA